jgi:hypothetical protein
MTTFCGFNRISGQQRSSSQRKHSDTFVGPDDRTAGDHEHFHLQEYYEKECGEVPQPFRTSISPPSSEKKGNENKTELK